MTASSRRALSRLPSPSDLPYVQSSMSSDGFDYWAIESAGAYALDTRLGRVLAAETVGYLARGGHPWVLSDIVGAIVAKAERDEALRGLRVGFFCEIGRVLYRGEFL